MTKEFLRAFRAKVRESRQLREQLLEMETRIYSPKGQKLTSTPRNPGSGGHTMDDLAMVHIELMDRYRQKLVEVEQEQIAIERAMEILEPVERMVIRYRYLDLMGWEEVADRVHYGWTQTHKIHGKALRKLEAME